MSERSAQERISAYLDGELSAAEQAEVERALEADPALMQLHDELGRMKQLLQSLPVVEPRRNLRESITRAIEREELVSNVEVAPSSTPNRTRRRSWVMWAAGASAVAAASVMLVIVNSGKQNRQPTVAQHERSAERESLEERTAEAAGMRMSVEAGTDAIEDGAVKPFVTSIEPAVKNRNDEQAAMMALEGRQGQQMLQLFPSVDEQLLPQLLEQLQQQGSIELVYTGPQDIVTHVGNELAKAGDNFKLSESHKQQDVPAKSLGVARDKLPAAPAGRAVPQRKEQQAADSQYATEKSTRKIDASGNTKLRALGRATDLAAGESPGFADSPPTIELRGTKEELAAQLSLLLKQPQVQLAIVPLTQMGGGGFGGGGELLGGFGLPMDLAESESDAAGLGKGGDTAAPETGKSAPAPTKKKNMAAKIAREEGRDNKQEGLDREQRMAEAARRRGKLAPQSGKNKRAGKNEGATATAKPADQPPLPRTTDRPLPARRSLRIRLVIEPGAASKSPRSKDAKTK